MTKTVLNKVSSALSILGSGYILALVGGKWRTEPASADSYQRIMAIYSAFDLLFSFFFFFLGLWLIPAATGWWSAASNPATCSMQGFFCFFGGLGSVASILRGTVDSQRPRTLSHSTLSCR